MTNEELFSRLLALTDENARLNTLFDLLEQRAFEGTYSNKFVIEVEDLVKILKAYRKTDIDVINFGEKND